MNRPTGHILLPATPEHPRHSEASAVRLASGDILLAWSKFSGRGDNAGASIAALTYSSREQETRAFLEGDNARAAIAGGQLGADGGWRDERVLVANEAGLNVMSPALARLADGALGLLYSFRESTTAASRVFRRSEDEGRTWSAPVRLPQREPYQTGCHDRLAVLSGGRLVAPLHCTHDWHAHHLQVRVAWSDDHGRSWQLGEPLALPKVADSGESGCIEPDVAERANGSLLMAIRTAMGTIFRAESHDGGESWGGLRSMEVVAPVAPALLRRIPGTGDLLLIWNWRYDWQERLGGVRRPLACAVSGDGGDSWPLARRKILEDDPAATYAYPSCLFLDDEALITYHVTPSNDPGGQRSLKLLRLPLAWLHQSTD
jgi:sialidase-1